MKQKKKKKQNEKQNVPPLESIVAYHYMKEHHGKELKEVKWSQITNKIS